jgi:P-type E1-E2 ATPase
MSKDAFEDYKMHKNDAEENEEKTLVYDRHAKKFTDKTWENVCIGDIVKLEAKGRNDKIPADLMLLYCKSNDGQCLIETKNLDGETN